MNLDKLKEPFPLDEIKVRFGNVCPWDDKKGSALLYIDNRAVMDRLDEVVGAGNWQNAYGTGGKDAVLCGIGIKVDGEWVWKWDAADSTQFEAVKGGHSDAMKRAAVQWGIARYLYGIKPMFFALKPGTKFFADKPEVIIEAYKEYLLPSINLPGERVTAKGANYLKSELSKIGVDANDFLYELFGVGASTSVMTTTSARNVLNLAKESHEMTDAIAAEKGYDSKEAAKLVLGMLCVQACKRGEPYGNDSSS